MNQTKKIREWLMATRIAIESGSQLQLFDLFIDILQIDDEELLAQFCVQIMLDSDIKDFLSNPHDLARILLSDGWVAYENQTYQENIREFSDRQSDLEYYFGDYQYEVIERMESF